MLARLQRQRTGLRAPRLAAASSNVDPTHAQINNCLHRIIRDTDPHLGVNRDYVLTQLALETGICIDKSCEKRILDELTTLLANGGWTSHLARPWSFVP